MGPQSPHVTEHIPLHGSCLRSGGRFECELCYLEKVHEYTSSSSGSSRKKLWHEVTLREEQSLGLSGTISLWNKKTEQWTVRNPWSKNIRDRWLENNWIRNFVKIDKLIVQKSLSDHYCWSVHALRLSSLCGLVFAERPLQGIGSHPWHADGLRGFTTLGIFEEIQKLMKKHTQCEPEFQRQNHLRVNVLWHCMGRKRKHREMYSNSKKIRSTLGGFFAVIGDCWDMDQKRNGTKLVLINQTEIWELQKWWYPMKYRIWSSNISCIQCLWKRWFRKQRTWQEVHPLQWNWRKH